MWVWRLSRQQWNIDRSKFAEWNVEVDSHGCNAPLANLLWQCRVYKDTGQASDSRCPCAHTPSHNAIANRVQANYQRAQLRVDLPQAPHRFWQAGRQLINK